MVRLKIVESKRLINCNQIESVFPECKQLQEQNVFFSNQIAGFFDHQYLWKKLVNALDVLDRDNHQRNENL